VDDASEAEQWAYDYRYQSYGKQIGSSKVKFVLTENTRIFRN